MASAITRPPPRHRRMNSRTRVTSMMPPLVSGRYSWGASDLEDCQGSPD